MKLVDKALEPLSREAEKQAVIDAKQTEDKAKSDAARDLLLLSNLKLLYKIAGEFDTSMSVEDLVVEGTIGLMHAIDKFDVTAETRFISYAAFWIRQKMRLAIANKSGVIKVPAQAAVEKAKLLKVQSEFKELNNREPTIAELAELTGTAESVVRDRLYSLTYDIRTDDEGTGEPGKLDTSCDNKEDEEAKKQMLAHIDELSDKRRAIIYLYYGIPDPNKKDSDSNSSTAPCTYEEISQECGGCREHIRQLHELALGELREKIKQDK